MATLIGLTWAAGGERQLKGKKKKEQEMAINVCKIHIIWWAQDIVLV